MVRLLPLALVFLSLTCGRLGAAEFDRKAVRTRLEAYLKPSPPLTYRVNPPAPPGSKQEQLITFFLEKIRPAWDRLAQLQDQDRIYFLILHLGLYESEKEFESIQKKQRKAHRDKVREFSGNPAWKALRNEFAGLAEGLTGELAGFARESARESRSFENPAKARPLLKKLLELESEGNEALASPHFSEYRQVMQNLRSAFREIGRGERSFASSLALVERTMELRAMMGDDYMFYAYNESLWNELAVIRTKLAHLKGFATNTEAKLAHVAESHSPGLQTKEQYLAFLYTLLEETQPLAIRLDQAIKKDLGLPGTYDLSGWSNDIFESLIYQRVGDFFPAESQVEIIQQMLSDMGFSKKEVGHILFDHEPRAGKTTRAFMADAAAPTLMVWELNGETLDVVNWQPPEIWSDPLSVVAVTTDADSLQDVMILSHETGHALWNVLRKVRLHSIESMGWEETPSTLFEIFAHERSFVLRSGRNRQGQAIPEHQVDQFINQVALLEFMGLRDLAAMSIFELELWDYDYVSGDKTFVDRIYETSEKVSERLFGGPRTPAQIRQYAERKFFAGYLHEGHGDMAGYVWAKIAAEMVYEKLQSELSKDPSVTHADILRPLLSEGSTQPFPHSVERFTGKAFSPANYLSGLLTRTNEAISKLERSCEGFL